MLILVVVVVVLILVVASGLSIRVARVPIPMAWFPVRMAPAALSPVGERARCTGVSDCNRSDDPCAPGYQAIDEPPPAHLTSCEQPGVLLELLFGHAVPPISAPLLGKH